jgi:hypothetical protein
VALVEHHVVDHDSGRIQVTRHLQSVGTDAANVAAVADMHRSRGRIKDLNVFVVSGGSGYRTLLTSIVECAEWIGR